MIGFKAFQFQPNVCNRCHDLLMMYMNLGDIAVLNIKGSNYSFIISILTIGDIEIEKINFIIIKLLFFKKDVDIENVLVSNKISFDKKIYEYFIGYLYGNHKVKPSHKLLLKIILKKL